MAASGLPFNADPGAAPAAHAAATIQLKTSMLVPGLHNEELPLTDCIATMEALIREIGRRTQFDLIGGDGELIDFLDVRLNGRGISFYPDGLATVLKPGDSILVRLVPIGGG